MTIVTGTAAFILLAGCQNNTVDFQCTDEIGCISLLPDEPIKIGVLQALSGKVATLGKEQIRGFELALDQRDGILANRRVEMQTEDTGCTAEGGANAVLKIIADPKSVAIFGSTCSGAAATASKAMSAAGLTMISGNNSAPFLTAVGNRRAPHWQNGYFRTAANEENSGKAAALYAYRELGIRKAATINDGDIYTKGLTDGFITAFKALGGDIVLDTAVNKGDKEMKPVLTAVLNSGAQLLFFPLFQPEGNFILLKAREMDGFDDKVLMSDGALIDQSFLDAVGQKGKGMYFVGPAGPKGEKAGDLLAKYTAKYNTSPSVFYFLSGYDAANILFHGIEKAALIGEDGTLHIGRQALRNALYAVRQFQGVTGRLSCDEFGDCAQPRFNVLQLEDVPAGLAGLRANIKFSFAPEE
jgi:branched-chain amino acid transport system substrate-binding protein